LIDNRHVAKHPQSTRIMHSTFPYSTLNSAEL
jgi:hypothetical protein